MMIRRIAYSVFSMLLSILTQHLHAQNPLILDQFTADPSARVFDGRVFVYPSHDIPCQEGQGMIGFCMADYHVFSSVDLVRWVDHGVIVRQDSVPWVDETTYSMWAPDCIYNKGKYYFYFPAIGKDKTIGRGRAIGVAVAEKPSGPFIPEPDPISGVAGIDPNPFIDADGQAYLYWAGHGKLLMARLHEDLKSIVGEPIEVGGLPEGFKEGPYLFEREGIYYFTFPYVTDKTEKLAYAIGDNPLGPFEYKGVIMDESPTGCWTNHHSFIKFQGQWYLFYHHNDLSPEFDKNRSIRVDSLFFDADGSIRKVIPSLRGVGITSATDKIQLDRYSSVSSDSITLNFVNDHNRQQGWKIVMKREGEWVRYNRVDFGDTSLLFVTLNLLATKGGSLSLRLDNPEGPVLAKVNFDDLETWNMINAVLEQTPDGVHDLFLVMEKGEQIEIDWLTFE